MYLRYLDNRRRKWVPLEDSIINVQIISYEYTLFYG